MSQHFLVSVARSLSIGKVTRMSDHGAMPKLTLQRLPLDHFGSFVAAIDGVNTPLLQMAEEEPPCFTCGAHDAFYSQEAMAGQISRRKPNSIRRASTQPRGGASRATAPPPSLSSALDLRQAREAPMADGPVVTPCVAATPEVL